MQIFIYSCLIIYCGFYLFEAPIRYGLNSLGLDSLIFIRDIILGFPLLLVVFVKQFLQKKVHIAFTVFALLMLVHGAVSFLNIGSMFVISYSVKMLINVLAGAVFAPYLMKIPRGVVIGIFAIWGIAVISVFIDKYDVITYPWVGMETNIGGTKVEISRDWQIVGEDKRAGGLMRSSINVATIVPMLAFIIFFNFRYLALRLAVMGVTLLTVYWTTQKASLLSFLAACGLILIWHKKRIPMLKIGISVAFLFMILFPVILPQFIMPNDKGVFSLETFYMRIEHMWPEAWVWIERRELFPFGVGLGGIGGAQRFYAMDSVNYADNMFILLYAYFGILSFVYMGWTWWQCMKISNKPIPANEQALSMVFFIIFYGVALSMIEDQMASLFLGASVGWLASAQAKRESGNYAA